MAPYTAECGRLVTGESNQVLDVSPAEAAGKMGEVQRFHIEDGSSFKLIQGYASEESSEEDERKHPADVTLARVSSTNEVGISGSHQGKGSGRQANFSSKLLVHLKYPPKLIQVIFLQCWQKKVCIVKIHSSSPLQAAVCITVHLIREVLLFKVFLVKMKNMHLKGPELLILLRRMITMLVTVLVRSPNLQRL